MQIRQAPITGAGDSDDILLFDREGNIPSPAHASSDMLHLAYQESSE